MSTFLARTSGLSYGFNSLTMRGGTRASKINDIGQLRSSMSWVELPNLGISNLIALGPHHPCDHLEQGGLPFWLYLQHRTPLLADQWTQQQIECDDVGDHQQWHIDDRDRVGGA